MKILVTGGTGMLGKALRDRLTAVYVGSEQGDLRDLGATGQLFRHPPDCVIHCAATVGGIKDNSERPYDYFLDNAQINAHVMHACVCNRIPKVIAISSTCVYPANPPAFPITEEMLHAGPPEETNFGYAYAKRMMQVQMDAAKAQHGLNWTTIYPSNLYGPNDTFHVQRSHAIPAMMLKMHNAKKKNERMVHLLGTGRALRQFTFVNDLADFIVELAQPDRIFPTRLNFAYPSSYEIASAAQVIAGIVGYKGKFEWSGSLDGVARKDVDTEKAKSIYREGRFTKLADGLEQTYKWFLAHKPEGAA